MKRIYILALATPLLCTAAVRVETAPAAPPRIEYAAAKLRTALHSLPGNGRVLLATTGSPLLKDHPSSFAPDAREAFHILCRPGVCSVSGSDASGVLYGALELSRRAHEAGRLPASLDFSDAPQFRLRGPNIGMQKTAITYDGAMYDYRYTREEFPFFYDKARWLRYLDLLAENRMNTLYLWNGHPFTSLLKLEKYPEARELPDSQLEENMAMFRWLTDEAGRRGIWVIQMFYNIHISHALAKAKGLAYQHTTPTPFVSEYTRYCVSEFIRHYPNAGVMMTLGEALAPRHGPAWLAETIIPGVKDGMAAAGLTDQPPIIVRAHATDIDEAMRRALPIYKNIYTMHKWNGESLTWTDVRGDVRALHSRLVGLGSTHIANVHLLSNLEPFRWGSASYVQETMLSMRRLGIQGLHLYPLRYWDWPVSADAPPLEQIERDWIWFEAWARYAWKADRDPAAERAYWVKRHGEKYGDKAGEGVYEAYRLAGPCQPRLLPRIGITEGNRQAFSLGMLMTQLIDGLRFNEFPLLWNGDAPEGERLLEYAEREFRHQPHTGETPVGVAEDVTAAAIQAVKAAESAAPFVTRNKEEFARLLNDFRCIEALMRYYRARTLAAALVLRYGHSRELSDLRQALPLVEESVGHYRRLLALTDKAYREACSVHSHSRRVPFLGAPGRYTHWRDCLPAYERELANFQRHLKELESGHGAVERERAAWKSVKARNIKGAEVFEVRKGERIYSAAEPAITDLAGELTAMTGLRVPQQEATTKGARVEFTLDEPAQVLVGFFSSQKKGAAATAPKDEWEPVLRNGVAVSGHPNLTVYSHSLPAGPNQLDFGVGGYVVLGFVPRDAQPEPRMVFFAGSRPDLDWLFE